MLILSRIFSLPYSVDWGDAWEARREHSQDSWPELTEGIFHTIWHHAGGVDRGRELLLGVRLGIGVQVVRNCTVHHSFCIFYYYYFCLCCPIKLSLFQPTSFTFFPLILLPTPPGSRLEGWVSGCVVLSCQLGLNDHRSDHKQTGKSVLWLG